MRKHSPALQAFIDSASSKFDESGKIKLALGSNRRLCIYRDSNPNAPDPASTGVKTLDVGLVGEMIITGGEITHFGYTTDTLVNLGTDLSTGASVMRIEGGGHWLEGTVGLVGFNRDWELTGNITTTSGIAFASSAGLRAMRFRPSGTGPVAPTEDAGFYRYARLVMFPGGVRTVAGTLPMDTRYDDIVFEDSEVAENIGDVRITISSETIVYGTGGAAFQYGGTVMSVHKGINDEDPNKPVHQFIPADKPYGRWIGYPTNEGFDPAYDSTFPPAHKWELLAADGVTILDVIEMSDGMPKGQNLPVNDPSLAQGWSASYSTPLRPFITCATLTPKQSHLLKDSTYAEKYVPGMTAISPYAGRNGASTGGAIPLVSGRGQQNSQLQFYAAPWKPIQWTPSGQHGILSHLDDADKPDPYLYDVAQYNSGPLSRITGLEYEPGSITNHDQLCGAGGGRFDRHAAPTQIILYQTDKNGVRAKGQYAHKLIKHHYGLAMFNHNCHFVRDVQMHTTLPVEDVLYAKYGHMNAYYTTANLKVYANLAGKTPDQAHVNLFGHDGSSWPVPVDPVTGLHQYQGHVTDFLHAYRAPGYYTMLYNSPMHVLAQKHVLINTWLAQTGTGPLNGPHGYFMTRQHAWRLLQSVISWKIGTKHPYGVSQALIEKHMQDEYETQYDNIYVPCMIQNSQAPFYQCLRKFGIPGEQNDIPTGNKTTIQSTKGTGSISGDVLTITDAEYGLYTAGQKITGTGVLANTYIDEVLTNSGIVGTYRINNSQTVASTTINGSGVDAVGTGSISGTTFTVTSLTSGYYRIGQRLFGTGIAADTFITAYGTGIGAEGTYTVGLAQTAPSTTVTGTRIDYYWTAVHDFKTFYMGYVYLVFRQTGFMKKMRAKSEKCRIMIDFMIECLDKYSIEYFMGNHGSPEGSSRLTKKFLRPQDVVLPADWAEHRATVNIAEGPLHDWITRGDGTRRPEIDISQHLRTQYVFIRKDYFPDYPHPQLDAAVARVEDYYTRVDALVAAATTAISKRGRSFSYRVPSHERPKPPTVLAPIN